MAQPRLSVTLGEAGATLVLHPEEGAKGEMALSFRELGDVIAMLGTARARLVAASPPDAKERRLEANGVQAVVGPAWVVRPEALTEGSMLTFAHPAFGTVGFVLPAPEVEKMIRALTSHLAMMRTGEVGEARN